MPIVVTMPNLGDSVEEGEVVRWLKSEGDRVEADEVLVEIATDKVESEIPAPATGVLSRIIAPPETVVAVGAPLGEITEE